MLIFLKNKKNDLIFMKISFLNLFDQMKLIVEIFLILVEKVELFQLIDYSQNLQEKGNTSFFQNSMIIEQQMILLMISQIMMIG